jgi:hypothetical protein
MVIILKENKTFYKNLNKEGAEFLKTNGKLVKKEKLIIQKLKAILKTGTGEI